MQKGDDLARAASRSRPRRRVLGWTVSRLDAARRTAEQRERETQIRLDLTTRLHGGRGPRDASSRASADALVSLFWLVACTVRVGGRDHDRRPTRASRGTITVVRIAPLEVEASASRERPLTRADRALLEALVAGLATAVDRLRLEAEARDARIDGAGRPHPVRASSPRSRTTSGHRSRRSRLRRRRCARPISSSTPTTAPSSSTRSTTRPSASNGWSPTSSSSAGSAPARSRSTANPSTCATSPRPRSAGSAHSRAPTASGSTSRRSSATSRSTSR